MPVYCNKKNPIRYLKEEMDLDEKLTFLFHLDTCSNCWEAVYNATKAEHPHYYKVKARRIKQLSEKELRKLDTENRGNREVFEVA